MKKQFIVLGLGHFGDSVARALIEQGAEVLVVDKDEEKVNDAAEYATYAVQADITDEPALKSLGLDNFDVACVCVRDVQASIMGTLICKDHGIETVVAKAQTDTHAKVLYKLGADKVIFPERDMGVRVAHNLLSSSILDYIELSDDYGIAEVEAHPSWVGKTLTEVNFRRKYGINIIGIKKQTGDVDINPLPTDRIERGDTLVVIASEDHLNKLEHLE